MSIKLTKDEKKQRKIAEEKIKEEYEEPIFSEEMTRPIKKSPPLPPLQPMSKSEIDEAFSSEMGGEHDIVKELFSVKNVYARTDLTEDEISVVSRLYYLSEYIEHPELAKLLDKLLMLKISKKRKSREEFVKAITGLNKPQNGGFGQFGQMGGFR